MSVDSIGCRLLGMRIPAAERAYQEKRIPNPHFHWSIRPQSSKPKTVTFSRRQRLTPPCFPVHQVLHGDIFVDFDSQTRLIRKLDMATLNQFAIVSDHICFAGSGPADTSILGIPNSRAWNSLACLPAQNADPNRSIHSPQASEQRVIRVPRSVLKSVVATVIGARVVLQVIRNAIR
jgi:hypothetical protein